MTRRVLMSRPSYLPQLADERSWVEDASPLDRGRAVDQWEALRGVVESHIAPVVELQAEPWAPAMAFTRDGALSADDKMIPLLAHRARGPFEAPLVLDRLVELGVDVVIADSPLRLDGGNILADTHGRLLFGVLSDEFEEAELSAIRFLEQATGRAAYKVPLTGGRFPHVDMGLCDLNGRAWIAYPGALAGFDPTDSAWAELLLGLPVIEVSAPDGEQLACNLIVHNDLAIGPKISTDLRRQIQATGMHYVSTPLDELLKAGGGAHCLTLELPT